MLDASMPTPSASDANLPTQSSDNIDIDNPLSPHESGIYIFNVVDGKPKMTELEPTAYSAAKITGGFFTCLTGGIAKMNDWAVMSGESAKTKLSTPRPVFYFYFKKALPNQTSSHEDGYLMFRTATNPSEFALIKAEIGSGGRWVIVGSHNAYGSSRGLADCELVAFSHEKIATGIYKVTPKSDLDEGEYCFQSIIAAPAAAYTGGNGGRVFDFGIRR